MRPQRDHFEINGLTLSQENCGMRISADAISFASWLEINEGSFVIDIGTGCGILALLCAQKGAGKVLGVEIDQAAAATAKSNFQSSMYSNIMEIIHDDAMNYSGWNCGKADHIISNPPWYKDSPDAADRARQQARIQDSLKTEDILHIAGTLLNEAGRLSLILPAREYEKFRIYAELQGWWPHRIGRLFTKAEKSPLRYFSEWRRAYAPTQKQDIFR